MNDDYWKQRAEDLRPQLDELQRMADEGRLPPADDIEQLLEIVSSHAAPSDAPTTDPETGER